jgi:RND family efflux transporter MFP subunit
LIGRRAGRGAVVAAIAAATLAAACGRGKQPAEAAPGKTPPPAAAKSAGSKPAEAAPVTLSEENVAVVEERALSTGPEISGTLRARREAALRAEVGGAVLEVAAEAGQRVSAGQLLCRIDDTTLRQSLLAARSGVTAAANALRVAEANAKRARTLAEAGALSAQQAEQAEAGLEAARAQVADANARATLAAQQAEKARVRAPFAGVVAQRQVSLGDVVSSGTALFTVIDPARLQFEVSIPAARLGEVRPGARVDFAVTGFAAQRFAGRVDRVAPAVDPATGQVRVYVDVPNEDRRLISGLYAQGRVAATTVRAPAAPVDAVDTTTSPPTVMRVANGRIEKAEVRTGLRDDASGEVAITSGVAPGDVLVLGSARAAVAEGAPVRLARDGGEHGRAAGRRGAGDEPPPQPRSAGQRNSGDEPPPQPRAAGQRNSGDEPPPEPRSAGQRWSGDGQPEAARPQ